jgi:biotin synthase
VSNDILDQARRQVLADGTGLDAGHVLRCLRLPDDRLDEALSLGHEVRMRWCGPEVEVIVSVKTGGRPEDCHFCSQSGRFESPAWVRRWSSGPISPGSSPAWDRMKCR